LATVPPAVSQVAFAPPLAQEASDPTFWQSHGDEVSAAITIVVAIVFAFLVDRLVIGRGARVAERFGDGTVSRSTSTRLRVVRRLVFVGILVIGIALALSQFSEIKRLATGILASSAVLGLIVGLAARQTLGNMVAGLQLAVAQPIRLGDRVTFEEEEGRVTDLTLSYTYLDPGDGRMIVIPNEKIVSGTVFNHSTGNQAAPVRTSVWLPAEADVRRAEEVLRSGAGADGVDVAEWTTDGIRLEVRLPSQGHATRAGGEESALRKRSQRVLQEAGLLAPD
jgi:small-conductance mechanosensitive channel